MPWKLILALGLIGLVAGQPVGANATEAPQSLGAAPIAAQPASHETEALLRTVVAEMQQGKPDLSRMEPPLQQAAARVFQRLGTLQTAEYAGNQGGDDIYRVAFQNGVTVWGIQVAQDGKIAHLFFGPESAAR